MILYPDQRVEQPDNETVCFAAPIDECDWQQLYAKARYNELEELAMRYIIIENEDGIAMGDPHTSVYFMRNDQEINDRVCIILRRMEGRDMCLECAAWIRLKENYSGMIYICRGSTSAEAWQSYASAAGCEQHLVAMVDLELQ